MFVAFSWFLLCLFRLNAGRLAGMLQRGFGAPLYVMIVGAASRPGGWPKWSKQSRDFGVRLLGFLSGDDDRPATIRVGGEYPVYSLTEAGFALEAPRHR